MNKTALLFLTLAASSLVAQQPATMKATIESVDKMWDRAKHNSLSDLIRFQNLWYCCAREGELPLGGEGKVRILASYDAKVWSPVALIEDAGTDLRDPKFCLTKEDRLFLVAGGATYRGSQLMARRPRVVTSTDGKHWSPVEKSLADGDWMCRPILSAADKRYYAVAYNCYPNTGGPKFEPEWSIKLYNSIDAKAWSLTAPFDVKGMPNETTVRILKNGTMMALVRRESAVPAVGFRGMIGSAPAPYREWTWKELPVPVRGPNFIELPDGRLVAGSLARGQSGPCMGLFEMTAEGLTMLLELPSGGDCSYPGMMFHEGSLYVSYHSSHEGKTSVYIAKVKIE